MSSTSRKYCRSFSVSEAIKLYKENFNDYLKNKTWKDPDWYIVSQVDDKDLRQNLLTNGIIPLGSTVTHEEGKWNDLRNNLQLGIDLKNNSIWTSWKSRSGIGRELISAKQDQLPTIVKELEEAKLFNQQVYQLIEDYLGEGALLYSALRIEKNDVETKILDQVIHFDHSDVKQNELVMAFTIPYGPDEELVPMGTLYFLGSQDLSNKTPTNTRIKTDDSNNYSLKCVANRVLFLAQQHSEKKIKIGIMNDWFMAFDAGGLHAGQGRVWNGTPEPQNNIQTADIENDDNWKLMPRCYRIFMSWRNKNWRGANPGLAGAESSGNWPNCYRMELRKDKGKFSLEKPKQKRRRSNSRQPSQVKKKQRSGGFFNL